MANFYLKDPLSSEIFHITLDWKQNVYLYAKPIARSCFNLRHFTVATCLFCNGEFRQSTRF